MADMKRYNPLVTFVSFFITLNSLFFYGFVRDGTWLAIAILLIPLYLKIGRINFLIVSVSFTLITISLVIVAEFIPQEKAFKRPHQKLLTTDEKGRFIYRPDASFVKQQDHGNLPGLAKGGRKIDYESRKIVFKVDSFGFRNDESYAAQKFILIGDSFIAGNGNSQEDTLSSQLKNKFGSNTYNMGHPGAVVDYIENIKKFKEKYGAEFKALLFVFEGNDFVKRRGLNKTTEVRKFKQFYRRYLREYKKFFHSTQLYRYTFIAYHSVLNKLGLKKKNQVEVLDIKGHKMGVHRPSIKVVKRKAYEAPAYWEDGFKSIQENLAAIIFIPAKYRVYHDFPNGDDLKQLPNANWGALAEIGNSLGIPMINLTEQLRMASRKLLPKDEFTFWKDDTHWNANGIEVAARILCQTIKELNCTKISFQ
jgi:hypothetical protein